MRRKLTAQEVLDSDLDEITEATIDLQDSLHDIEFVNQNLANINKQLDQAASEQSSYPLPTSEAALPSAVDEENEGMPIAAMKFSTANKGGLQKVRRSASKKPSFAPWEIDDIRLAYKDNSKYGVSMKITAMTTSEIASKLEGHGCEVREKSGRVYVNSTPNGGRGQYGFLVDGDDGTTGTCQNITRRKGEIAAYLRA